MEKLWKVHPVFSDYHISDHGDVYSTYKKGKTLSPKRDKDGYLEVCLTLNKKRYYKRIHRLVADCFIENPDNLPLINHKDENKSNNFKDNLEWCNYYYNTTYSISSEWDKIKEIPALYLRGLDYKGIIEELGLSLRPETIGEILRGRKHSSITGISEDMRDKERTDIMKGSLSTPAVIKILEDKHHNKLSQTLIANKYNISIAAVSRIVNGVRYKDIHKRFMEENV